MSLKTCKKRVSAKSAQEKQKQEKHISDLLACEREFSLVQQKVIDDLKVQHSHVTGRLRAENESLQTEVQNFAEEIQDMQMFIHVKEKEYKDVIKKLDYQIDFLTQTKNKELSNMKQNYERKIEEITRHLKSVETELFQVKNFVKPHADVFTQTSFDASKTTAAERLIPLKTHLEMINSLKQSFMREKFQLHEEFLERLGESESKRQNSTTKGESDLISNDKQTLTNHTVKCQGSKLIVELEKQKNISEATKRQELDNPQDKNVECLIRNQSTICGLQAVKKERDLYIHKLQQQLDEIKSRISFARNETSSPSASQNNLDDTVKIKQMAQDILDQRSQAECYLFDVIKLSKDVGEDDREIKGKNGINGLNGVRYKQKEKMLNTLFSDMIKSTDQYTQLKEVLANTTSPLFL